MARLGIIAAKGTLPLHLAQAARNKGEEPFIVALKGHCDHDFEGFETVCLAVGKVGAIARHLKAAGCDRLMLAGQFKRPSVADISFDKQGLALMSRLMLTGDDAALRIVAAWFAEQGITVVANSDYLPEQVLAHDFATARAVTSGECRAARHARTVLERLGDLDVGQSAVVQQHRVLAVEGPEGTNQMISRAAELMDRSQPDTVFVKLAKSGQDIGLDMPVFGLDTLSCLEKAGIKVACLDSGRLMLADPADDIISAADKAGISVCSFASLPEQPDD